MKPSEVSAHIEMILERRRANLPQITSRIEQWEQLDAELANLERVSGSFAQVVPSQELQQQLEDFTTGALRGRLEAGLSKLRLLEQRFSRKTVNIGVSGQARVGKSTLLQSISGLGDTQLPTGSGLPVTAVRSQIFHSTQQRATLHLHTYDTLRDEVLQPYHEALGLLPVPATLREFRNYTYPTSPAELPEGYRERAGNIALLGRLRDELHGGLGSYEDLLTGGNRQVRLEELKPYVAYPSNEQQGQRDCPRFYVAVRHVQIECTFPRAQVKSLGIVDLPGMGEIAPHVQEHHVQGLQNEVDLVMLVKRPKEGMGYWKEEDINTVNLLDKARGAVARRDFVCVVLNTGGDGVTQEQTKSLRDDITRRANEGQPDKNFRVLEGDASDKDSVYDDILGPLLVHLAERLHAMDTQVIQGVGAAFSGLHEQIDQSIADLKAILAEVQRSGGDSDEMLDDRTEELRRDVAEELHVLVQNYKALAYGEDEDPQLMDALEKIDAQINAWIEDAFGRGEEQWCRDALRRMRADRGSAPFANDELNTIRVQISQYYAGLDDYFLERTEGLKAEVGAALERCMGDLLGARGAKETALQRLSLMLGETSQPCQALSHALDNLLKLSIEYLAQFHPKARRELDGLSFQTEDARTGESSHLIAVNISEEGAETLLEKIQELSHQASYMTKKAIIKEAEIPALILYTALEQFEDAFVRAGDSRREFKRLGRSFRHEIWPGVFEGITASNAHLAKVRRSVQAIEALNQQLR